MKPTDEEMERVLASADRLAASGAALVKAVGELGGRVVMSPQAFDALLSRAQAAEARAEEAERAQDRLTEELIQAELQITYLHDKFGETGSGNAVVASIRQALALPRGEG